MIVAAPRPLPAQLVNIGIFRLPPAYTRLEPQSVTGDPTPGVAAALHDPLWSLFRQWQVGEFAGEDAGTPLAVTMATASQPLTLFAGGNPSAAMQGTPLPMRGGLDRTIEAEAPPAAGQGSRQRAEAAATLVASLVEAGLDVGGTLRQLYPFTAGATGVLPRKALGIMLRTAADAEAIATALEGGTPDWLTAASDAAKAAAQDWLAWYRGNVSPKSGGACWDPKRLEYHFSVATDPGQGQLCFTAPMHLGGDVDWYELDQMIRTTMAAPAGTSAATAPPATTPPTALVAPLRFAGMPADRFWEFEDAQVNLGAMNVQVNDPARLCLIEFATVYGCDWYVAPVDVPASGFTTVSQMSVVDSFGVTLNIPRAGTGSGTARFRLYEPTISGSTETARGLLTVGGARGAIEGPPRETVYFLRDETANMAWAVETTVEDASGYSRSRQDETPPAAAPYPAPDPQAELRYTLETTVPPHWIPMVPVPMSGAVDGFVLRKGTMTTSDDSVGQVLAGKPRDIYDTEVPRTGIRVSRTPTLARDATGKLVRWTSYRVGEGYGGVSSGLASDQAVPYPQP